MKTISLKKKVAAVAVASLGFGLLSAVPASSAISAISDITVAEVAAGATNLNQIVEAVGTTAGARTYNIYTGGAASIATADIQTVTTGTGVSADPQRVWIAPGALTTSSAAVAAFGRFPATTVGGTVNANTFPAVTGSLTLTGTPEGLTTTTIAGSEAGTVYTIFAQNDGGTIGTPAAGNVTAQITVYTRTLRATLGDGGAPATQGAVNGVAGPANTVSVQAMDSDDQSTFNLRRLVTVSGAGAKITTATAAPVAVATDGLTAVITPNNSAPGFNTLTINTPNVGTATVSIFTETAVGSGIYGASAASTVIITVNAAAVAGGVNAATSTSLLKSGATWSSITADDVVSASRTQTIASGVVTPVASIRIALARTAGAITSTTPVTASISGPGTLYLNNDNDHTSSLISSGRSLSSTVGGVNAETFYVMVAPDGNSGVGVVTISVGGFTSTETVTFYGPAARYTATTILNATANGAATSDAVVVCAVDAANVAVPSELIYAYSGDTTVATVVASATTVSSAVVEDLNGATADTNPVSIAPTTYVAAKAIGCAGFAVTGLSQTTKSSAVITFGNAATQAASTVTTTATVNVGAIAASSVALTANKATYAPGERITLTLTYRDANGRLVAAGPGTATLAAALTSSVALSGDALFAANNNSKLGVTTISVFAPLSAGPVTLSGTTGAAGTFVATAAANAAVSATVTVAQNADIAGITTAIAALNARVIALNALIAKIMKRLNIR